MALSLTMAQISVPEEPVCTFQRQGGSQGVVGTRGHGCNCKLKPQADIYWLVVCNDHKCQT